MSDVLTTFRGMWHFSWSHQGECLVPGQGVGAANPTLIPSVQKVCDSLTPAPPHMGPCPLRHCKILARVWIKGELTTDTEFWAPFPGFWCRGLGWGPGIYILTHMGLESIGCTFLHLSVIISGTTCLQCSGIKHYSGMSWWVSDEVLVVSWPMWASSWFIFTVLHLWFVLTL